MHSQNIATTSLGYVRQPDELQLLLSKNTCSLAVSILVAAQKGHRGHQHECRSCRQAQARPCHADIPYCRAQPHEACWDADAV
jgi:hypothetical protein